MRQLTLIDGPSFTPVLPSSGLARTALDLLLSGRAVDHLNFQEVTGSWRFAAYVEILRRMGWPIESTYSPAGAHRNVALYQIDAEPLKELRAVLETAQIGACHA